MDVATVSLIPAQYNGPQPKGKPIVKTRMLLPVKQFCDYV